MKIFVSHASKNGEIAIRFARFLEEMSDDIEVFCSSEKGSIKVGKDFVKGVFDELSKSDLFIPIISKEYYESKFCMIELGVAFSYMYHQLSDRDEDYIVPFALYPIQKEQALAGTPLSNIQIGSISDKNDIYSFLENLTSDKRVNMKGRINQKIHCFIFDIEQIFLKNHHILERARIKTYFDDSIEFRNREDIVSASIAENTIIVNYNMNPNNRKKVKYPEFISMVLQYTDNIDLSRYLIFNDQCEFTFTLTNFTNSLKWIVVEFKHQDGSKILRDFQFPVKNGENKFNIPLSEMQSKALSNISEICFVIHPRDVIEEEGMFKIGGIEIR